MTDHEHAHQPRRHSPDGGFWGSRAFIVWLALVLIGGFLLVSEHRAHALGVGLWLLIFACPLLHIFGHGGHGAHGGHGYRGRPNRANTEPGRSTGDWDDSQGDKS